MAVALGVVSVVLAGVSAVQQSKAAKVQRKQNEVSNRIQANQRMRSVKRAIAASRVRQGEVQAAGFQGGVAGGTAVAGALGGLRSDLGSSIGASNQQLTGQTVLSGLSNKISSLQSSAATASALGSIAGQFTGSGQGTQNLEAVSSFF